MHHCIKGLYYSYIKIADGFQLHHCIEKQFYRFIKCASDIQLYHCIEGQFYTYIKIALVCIPTAPLYRKVVLSIFK